MTNNEAHCVPGVSVIIPSYRGGKNLDRALGSLCTQTIATSGFEVIVVLNGPSAQRSEVMRLLGTFSSLNIRVFTSSRPSASRARNIGLTLAAREFVTFLDDDDMLEERYLETAMHLASGGCIALMPILDQRGQIRDEKSSLNVRISANAGKEKPISDLPWALGFNACKVLPTQVARRYRYNEALSSGEDLVYFAHLLKDETLTFEVSSTSSQCSYVRQIAESSVSRQPEGFEFNVRQRLACLKALQEIPINGASLVARRALEKAQFAFVERYLEHHPEDAAEAFDCAVKLGVTDIPWEKLRGDRAKSLVFSYCFPPYADTSANVVAKVIRSEQKLVDVFYAEMSSVRIRDDSTVGIVAPYLVHSLEIKVAPSFANWSLISEFGEAAANAALRQSAQSGAYQSVYSRALWSGSHVAALLFKQKQPGVTWIAEFSDPLILGADGKPRVGKLTKGAVTDTLTAMLRNTVWRGLEFDSHFALTELVTFIYADELIFTNANQREVMLEKYPIEFQNFVSQKSKIRHHVVPTPEMYHLAKADYGVDPDCLNLGYFGNFYSNRGIGEVVSSLEKLPITSRKKVVLHIFTGDPVSLSEELQASLASDSIRINPYVKYLEFLNLSTKFDVLIVNDTDTSGTGFHVNPFLPSKFADYAGSEARIWGVLEQDSPLTTLSLDYVSWARNADSSYSVLLQLVEEKFPHLGLREAKEAENDL